MKGFTLSFESQSHPWPAASPIPAPVPVPDKRLYGYTSPTPGFPCAPVSGKRQM